MAQRAGDPVNGRPVGQVQIDQAQVRPFEPGAVLFLQLMLPLQRRHGKRAVQGVPNDGGLPGEGGLGRPGGFAKRPAPGEVPEKFRHIGGQVQQGFADATHRAGGALGKQGAHPIVGVTAHIGGAEGVQVVGKGAGHEFHLGQRKRSRGVPIIPAAINGDVAQRITGGKSRAIGVDAGVIAEPVTSFRRT